MSGSVTISRSGVPARFRSMPDWPMKSSCRVLLQMRAHQAHGLLLVAEVERHLAALHHGNLELADLVALGQVGVEVVLARKNALWRNVGAECQS
jgi:hypothetical protein